MVEALQAIFTDPLYQGKGAASLIMNEMTTRADAGGWICQIDGNPAALKFYERFGFVGERVGRHDQPEWTTGKDLSYDFLVREPRQ